MKESVEDLLKECETLHGHMCAGQLLGVRMSILGCQKIGVSDPRGVDCKKLLVWVEIDRCMTDAISAATGVRLGKRTLKYVDYGKVAATFLNIDTKEAIRIVVHESARTLADERHPEITDKHKRQFEAYMSASDDELFKVERVSVEVSDFDVPGRPRSRTICSLCGEGVNDGRERTTDGGDSVCKSCAEGAYYARV